jgi:hypothetical protein
LHTIDCHYQPWQNDLALEKFWRTKDNYFQLITTLGGITAIDCSKLAEYHGFTNWSKRQANIGIQFFVCWQVGEEAS